MDQSEPKILTIDIETFPAEVYAWGMYDQNILDTIRDGVICAFSAKWTNGKHIVKALPDYDGYNPKRWNDKKIVQEIRDLLDEADIVVGQNSERFDIKTINARMLFHRMSFPAPFQNSDTLKMAKSVANLPSYKLIYMARYWNLPHQKLSTDGFKLWKECMAGDMKAWAFMKKYNAQDVLATEDLYFLLRPVAKNQPNMGLYYIERVCPKCGSDNIHFRGTQKNKAAEYPRIKCLAKGCDAWSRSNQAIKRKVKLLIAI